MPIIVVSQRVEPKILNKSVNCSTNRINKSRYCYKPGYILHISSKDHRTIATGKITSVDNFQVSKNGEMFINNQKLNYEKRLIIATINGFQNVDDYIINLQKYTKYPLPYNGIFLTWDYLDNYEKKEYEYKEPLNHKTKANEYINKIKKLNWNILSIKELSEELYIFKIQFKENIVNFDFEHHVEQIDFINRIVVLSKFFY